jgi:hypothetical protein
MSSPERRARLRWPQGRAEFLRSAVVETEELVAAAVNATGIPEERMRWTELARIEYITVQLYGSPESVRIEVWDSAPNPPSLAPGLLDYLVFAGQLGGFR